MRVSGTRRFRRTILQLYLYASVWCSITDLRTPASRAPNYIAACENTAVVIYTALQYNDSSEVLQVSGNNEASRYYREATGFSAAEK